MVVCVGATVIVPPVVPWLHVRTPLHEPVVSVTLVPGQTGDAGAPLTVIAPGVLLTVIVTAELAVLAVQDGRVQVAV